MQRVSRHRPPQLFYGCPAVFEILAKMTHSKFENKKGQKTGISKRKFPLNFFSMARILIALTAQVLLIAVTDAELLSRSRRTKLAAPDQAHRYKFSARSQPVVRSVHL